MLSLMCVCGVFAALVNIAQRCDGLHYEHQLGLRNSPTMAIMRHQTRPLDLEYIARRTLTTNPQMPTLHAWARHHRDPGIRGAHMRPVPNLPPHAHQ